MSDQTICRDCGMVLASANEFHPYLFCAIKKDTSAIDPWEELMWVNRRLGIDTTHWPKRPPALDKLERPVAQ